MSVLNSLRGQLAVTAVAAISLLALTGILVRDVVVGAEERIVSEAEQQCATAAAELARAYSDRLAFRQDEDLAALPLEAQDLSLRALSATVLRSYDGLRGGFLVEGRVIGAAGSSAGAPLPRLSGGETAFLLMPQARGTWRSDDGEDILVAAAVAEGRFQAWALRRLQDVGSAAPSDRTWLLGGLALSALLGFGALMSISYQLRRGVADLHQGLERLESDLSHRLPAVSGDLGALAVAINKMAGARDALEEHVRQQEKLAALGRVVGGVAHEIRNPLNSLRLTLELLARRVRKQEAEPESLDTAPIDAAVAEVDRLDEILTKLLAFGKPGAETRERQPLEPSIRHAVSMAAERAARKRIEIGVETSTAGEAVVDASQIEQVLLNLLLNAVEASPENGSVDVTARNGSQTIEIDVSDTGPGVDQDVRERIFDPYFTTKETGSGLGLAVSREILRRQGGELSLESEPGRTVFRVTLPAASKESA